MNRMSYVFREYFCFVTFSQFHRNKPPCMAVYYTSPTWNKATSPVYFHTFIKSLSSLVLGKF